MDSVTRVTWAREALAPYPWRTLTLERLVRQILSAVDGRMDGRPVAPDDRRVAPVVETLALQPWRELTLGELCRRVLATLDLWESRELWWELELAMLLDEHR
jgi:hypothetical protein